MGKRPILLKLDIFSSSTRQPSKAGVIFTVLTAIAVGVYAGFLAWQNFTEIQTTATVYPATDCHKAEFVCKDIKGCSAAVVGTKSSSFTDAGLLTTTVTDLQQNAKSNFYLCPGGEEGVHLGPSSDILTLDDGEFAPSTAVYNPTIDFAFVATNTNPARVIKAALGTMTRTSSLKLNNGESFAKTSVLIGQKMYVGLSSGSVVEVDVSGTGITAPTRVKSVNLGGPVVSSTASPDGTFGLFGVYGSPPLIVEVHLASLTVTRNVSLQSTGSPSALTESGGHLVVGFSGKSSAIPSPRGAFVQKIRISDFKIIANASLSQLPPFGEEWISVGLNGGQTSPYVWFGTTRINDGQPASIIQIKVSDMTSTRIQLKGGETSVVSAVKVANAGFFVVDSSPPRLLKYALASSTTQFKRVAYRDVSNPGPNQISSVSLTLSDSDKYVYVGGGSGNTPGRIKRYSPKLGLEEYWGDLKITQTYQSKTISSGVVRIPPAPQLGEASVFLTQFTYINASRTLKVGFNAPLTPSLTVYPCDLNTQERCCVVNGASLIAVIEESFMYSWISFVGALGGFAGIAMKFFSPFLGVIGGGAASVDAVNPV